MELQATKTLKQIANELNVSPGAVKRRIKAQNPLLYSLWYGKKRKRTYYPTDLKLLKELL